MSRQRCVVETKEVTNLMDRNIKQIDLVSHRIGGEGKVTAIVDNVRIRDLPCEDV